MKVGGLEAQTKTSYIDSTPETLESAATAKEPNTQFSSFERVEGSFTVTKQFVPQVFNCHPATETHQSSFSKLLFTEWLSLDHVHCQNLVSSGEPVVSKETRDDSNPNDAFGYDFLHDEGLFGGEFSSQFKFESQIPGSEFLEFDTMGEICSDFNMTYDVNYL
ncbi:hypothetical protein HHK36_001120 [Tetracentron sinense]|uniref:Uncharacterized protein n=1 Tax=Tetracentron sinense TaxID=13715 RepID=A0A834ZSA1_TETSI|nr:hypothetical protein HHK36_001120 [Tetracentron sinense]